MPMVTLTILSKAVVGRCGVVARIGFKKPSKIKDVRRLLMMTDQ